MREMPFFLTNPDWYETPQDLGLEDDFFLDGRGYRIKETAPEEAKQSYMEFYEALTILDADGNPVDLNGRVVN